MLKNRLIVVFSVVVLSLVAVSQVPIAAADCENASSAAYVTGCTNVLIPVTGSVARDYIDRHPEMLRPGNAVDLSDFYQRHSTTKIAEAGAATDYFQRHPELLRTSNAVDQSDWFLRHAELITR